MQQEQTTASSADLAVRVAEARERLDDWVRTVVAWHFDPQTGTPFWLDYARQLGWDPRREIHGFDDLSRFPLFEDEWLRGGPVRRWVPRAYADRPIYVFETGGSTGIPRRGSTWTTSASTIPCSARRSANRASRAAPTG